MSSGLRPSWPIDSGTLESPLEHARRGDLGRREVAEQLQADPAGTPGRVVVLELARRVEDRLRGAGGGLPTGVVSKGQPPLAVGGWHAHEDVGMPPGPPGRVSRALCQPLELGEGMP